MAVPVPPSAGDTKNHQPVTEPKPDIHVYYVGVNSMDVCVPGSMKPDDIEAAADWVQPSEEGPWKITVAVMPLPCTVEAGRDRVHWTLHTRL